MNNVKLHFQFIKIPTHTACGAMKKQENTETVAMWSPFSVPFHSFLISILETFFEGHLLKGGITLGKFNEYELEGQAFPWEQGHWYPHTSPWLEW